MFTRSSFYPKANYINHGLVHTETILAACLPSPSPWQQEPPAGRCSGAEFIHGACARTPSFLVGASSISWPSELRPLRGGAEGLQWCRAGELPAACRSEERRRREQSSGGARRRRGKWEQLCLVAESVRKMEFCLSRWILFERWRDARKARRALPERWRNGLRFCCASTSSSPPPPAPPEEPDDYELLDTTGNCDPLCSVDEVSSQYFEANYKPKNDLLKALTIIGTALAGAAAINHSWVAAKQDIAMVLVFAIGYVGVIFEESLAFNKSGVALLMAVCLWVIRSIGAPSTDVAVQELSQTTSEVSEIVFFLLGAMTIVEIVDAHQGFKLVTDNISTRNPKTLLWVIGIVTFFLSSILDNLTSTIVMVSLLQKLVPPSEYRKLLGAVVVIAANAGGAWTPIGDVTTTMLWIHGQITTLKIMQGLFIPSAVSLAVPLALMSLTSEANGSSQKSSSLLSSEQMAPRGQLVLGVGAGALVFVPIFKALTGLPPFMGMLLGLGILWILTDAIHYGDAERQQLKVPQALSRIDTQGILFFLGILLSVGSLESAGILRQLANYLDANIPNADLIASAIGVASAVIDNVPLVAATMGMYDLTSFPPDSDFWQLVAFCAGTGGSMLIIGSAAGVAFMGMEKVDFFWYFRKVSGFALAGYAAGIISYLAAQNLHLSLPTSLSEISLISGS